MNDTLKQIAEDTLLTAANVRTGEYSYFRAAEVIVNLAERIVEVTGLDPRTVWTPESVSDMLDPFWGVDYEVRS